MRTSEAQFKRNKYQNIYDPRNAPRHGYVPKIRPPLGDVLLHKVAQGSRQAVVDMPAERIDEDCNEATGSREAVDFKIYPIPSEQSRAAKNANNKKPKQEATMQIGPKDHYYGQQKTSRSFQTFSVENYAKQHRRNIWRSGEIDIWGRRKSGVKQTRGKNRNTNCNCRGSGAQADGREISGYGCATCNYK